MPIDYTPSPPSIHVFRMLNNKTKAPPAWLPYRLRSFLGRMMYLRHVKKPYTSINYFGVEVPLSIKLLSKNVLLALFSGNYEWVECKHLPLIIAPGERILEVGVGLGVVSTIAQKHKNTESYYGIEADPDVVQASSEVFRLNHLPMKVENTILTNSQDTADSTFYRRNDFWASSGLIADWGHRETLSIPTKHFNTALKEFNASMLICDIEGGEYELLINSQLESIRTLVLEVHPSVIGNAKTQELLTHIKSLGFVQNDAFSQQHVHIMIRG